MRNRHISYHRLYLFVTGCWRSVRIATAPAPATDGKRHGVRLPSGRHTVIRFINPIKN
nr:MAG TPA: hypothetical protein [Bacteriophage sp.]